MKLKKNDIVKVLSGKDKGKSGKITQVFPEENKVVVEGINIHYKNLRPKKQGEKGQRIEYSAPFSAAKLIFSCPKCGRISRLGIKVLDNKERVRCCKKCQEVV